jgi:hypothetical protein
VSGANGLLVITVGILVIWLIVANKGACAGGFFSCLIGGGTTTIPKTGTN